jgi:lipid-A-disaccharide synthase
VAGEASGDILGAGLIEAIRARCPDAVFEGIGGELMQAAGLESWYPLETLAVNGFIDPIKRLPKLVEIYLTLRRRLLSERPDVFIGVDFNVFNLIVERALHDRGVRTAHYVSPSVYAWRRARLRRIAKAVDLMLTLFPFEAPLYAKRGVRAVFVGHPLADEIAVDISRSSARRVFDIPDEDTVIALLPGSRMGEIRLMAQIFLDAAVIISRELGACRFLVPCVSDEIRSRIEALIDAGGTALDIRVLQGHSRDALAACDGAIVKSGTGTLEAMLINRPMVVAYRLGLVSYHIVKRMIHTPFVALPNILANRAIVPELLQDEVTPEALAAALLREMREGSDAIRGALFCGLHEELRRGASARAADAVLELAGAARGP